MYKTKKKRKIYIIFISTIYRFLPNIYNKLIYFVLVRVSNSYPCLIKKYIKINRISLDRNALSFTKLNFQSERSINS